MDDNIWRGRGTSPDGYQPKHRARRAEPKHRAATPDDGGSHRAEDVRSISSPEPKRIVVVGKHRGPYRKGV